MLVRIQVGQSVRQVPPNPVNTHFGFSAHIQASNDVFRDCCPCYRGRKQGMAKLRDLIGDATLPPGPEMLLQPHTCLSAAHTDTEDEA